MTTTEFCQVLIDTPGPEHRETCPLGAEPPEGELDWLEWASQVA